ncbi:hypothetical protein [Staphylococcus pettenkoferi]
MIHHRQTNVYKRVARLDDSQVNNMIRAACSWDLLPYHRVF